MTRDELILLQDSIFQHAQDIMRQKNHDYAGKDRGEHDPFRNLEACDRMGVTDALRGVLVRLTDKFSRLASFIDNDGDMKVSDEKVLDTVTDAINYFVLFAALAETRRSGAETCADGVVNVNIKADCAGSFKTHMILNSHEEFAEWPAGTVPHTDQRGVTTAVAIVYNDKPVAEMTKDELLRFVTELVCKDRDRQKELERLRAASKKKKVAEAPAAEEATRQAAKRKVRTLSKETRHAMEDTVARVIAQYPDRHTFRVLPTMIAEAIAVYHECTCEG